METYQLAALRVKQNGHTLFIFAVDAKRIGEFAAVPTLTRTDNGLAGYQRGEVTAHVKGIRDYLNSDDAMLPNALVLSFDKRVKFKQAEEQKGTEFGTLIVPLDEDNPAGHIVDGQQRSAAIRDSVVNAFMMPCVGFVPASAEEARMQFLLLNNSRPLPGAIVNELIPGITGKLPTAMEVKRLPMTLVARLNDDRDSPLYGLIKTATNPGGIVKDTSVERPVEISLAEGHLAGFRMGGGNEKDNVDGMVAALKEYWAAVSGVFGESWGLPLKESRLFHAAGFSGLGAVMDAIADQYDSTPSLEQFSGELKKLKPYCHWTSGEWEMGSDGRRNWDDVQNTAKDIRVFTAFMVRTYREVRKRKKMAPSVAVA